MANQITITPYGFVLLPVYIKPSKSTAMEATMYKVDTGANCTTIGVKRLLELGYDENWVKAGKLLEENARPTLASGLPVDDCYEVILSEIKIGDWVGYNWPVLTSLDRKSVV